MIDTVLFDMGGTLEDIWSMTKAAILPFRVCWIFCTLTASI